MDVAVGKEGKFASWYDLYPVGGLAVMWGVWDHPDIIVNGLFLCVSSSYWQDPHPSLL